MIFGSLTATAAFDALPGTDLTTSHFAPASRLITNPKLVAPSTNEGSFSDTATLNTDASSVDARRTLPYFATLLFVLKSRTVSSAGLSVDAGLPSADTVIAKKNRENRPTYASD